MLTHIHSLPALLKEGLDAVDDSVRSPLDRSFCRTIDRVIVIGCGDSHHAAVASELAFEAMAGVPAEPMTALQFSRYAAGFLPRTRPGRIAVIGISVSGEVSRTAEALRLAGQAGARTLAITAAPLSRVASNTERVVRVEASPVSDDSGPPPPGVRSYALNLLGLFLLSIHLGEMRGRLTPAQAATPRRELQALADAAAQTIDACDSAALALARDWSDAQEFVFLGGGPNLGTAMFSAAKVLEASGDSAWGQDMEEWAHLQYFAKAETTPTFLISDGRRDLSRAIEVAEAARAIGRRVVAVAPRSAQGIHGNASRSLPLPEGIREMFSPIVAAVPGALFAAHRAERLGEPYFRGFGGGRSVAGGGGISRIRTSEELERLERGTEAD